MKTTAALVFVLATTIAAAECPPLAGPDPAAGCVGEDGRLPRQAGPPHGRAGGDLDGSYPDPEVVGLRGREIASASPGNNDVLVYEYGRWNPMELDGDVSGDVDQLEVVGLRGRELATTSPRSGDVLSYTGYRWEPVRFEGDLTGEVDEAKVTGLLGRPLSTDYPETGDVLTWDGWRWVPLPPSESREQRPAPASDWLEEFGGFRLTQGRASVQLAPGYLARVRVSESSPLRVFLQQTSGEPVAVVVEKGFTGFAVRGPEGSTAGFDYRVAARRD